ncbi:MAG: GxxExxY protein [Spirochaetales bacterium]|nr:GxxExxY protein [Spirochaetales bacterium]
MNDLIYADETYRMRGALFEVYKHLGCGFLEAVYQEAVELEFIICKIPFQIQKEIVIKYKNNTLKQKYFLISTSTN